MRDPRKLGRNLLVMGVLFIIFSIPNFFIASQKSEEADRIRQTNEARAQVREDSANFNRSIAYILLIGGAVSIVCGFVTSRRR